MQYHSYLLSRFLGAQRYKQLFPFSKPFYLFFFSPTSPHPLTIPSLPLFRSGRKGKAIADSTKGSAKIFYIFFEPGETKYLRAGEKSGVAKLNIAGSPGPAQKPDRPGKLKKNIGQVLYRLLCNGFPSCREMNNVRNNTPVIVWPRSIERRCGRYTFPGVVQADWDS